MVSVGLLVVILLRDNLIGTAELKAEFTGRSVADQLVSGTSPKSLELPDDDRVVQIVDAAGTVVAASDDLSDSVPVASYAPRPEASDRDDDDSDDDDAADGDHSSRELLGDSPNRTLDVPDEDGRYAFFAITAITPDGEALSVYSGVSLATQDQVVTDATRAMLWALPLLLAVVAVVTWAVTRRALRPVNAIRAELAEITAGDLSRRVPEPASRDEIHALARTTNTTLAALDAAVTQQRRFIADASHELRSPLAILRARLEVASAHPELLNVDETLEDVVRLQGLATDLLLLARLDAGQRPGFADVDLTELVRETVARRAAGDPITVELSVDEDVTVSGVKGQLERVLSNLLDNAQRHARERVAVSLRAKDGRALLEVSDDGAGIPAADRDRVFDRFVRLDSARDRDAGGAGLGLAIVRDVVRAHGGTIEVSTSVHKGARFAVRL
ncbi:HAMP domain-containing sensor histidine kinase [Stackebrandtia sp.]|jgi:signal transduction histidine kinase|uniref:sensor histidine kinase n=1 Tax=Stackebrandtia sp. TaxID=2023065 RepID=UPI0032C227B0